MTDARVDLHTHTTYSDGTLAPAELVQKAHAAGLRALAVTDHDTMDGVAEALAAGAELGVEVVPGIELSVTVEMQEVHVLVYYVDRQDPALREHLERFKRSRIERARRMVAALNDLGVALPFEAVERQAGKGAYGRPHVAAALLVAGFVDTYDEAFARYIGDGGPAYVPKPAVPAAEALRMVRNAGGLSVLAHPGHWTSDRVIMHLIRAGLDGIETVHPSHDDMLTRYYQRLAREFILLETGGSDYHGPRPDGTETFGIYTVPYVRLERLKQRRERHAAERLPM